MWSVGMITLCSLWLVSEFLINIFKRSRKTVSNSYDNNSLTLIWVTITFSVSIGVFIAFAYPMFDEARYFTGVVLLIVGIVIRFYAMFSLKIFFTSDVSIHHDHKLISNGLYSKVRHPSYSGNLLSFLGLALALGNWFSLLIIFVPVLIVFLYRIKIEEKVLVNNFKDEYISYKKKTKKLIPYVY